MNGRGRRPARWWVPLLIALLVAAAGSWFTWREAAAEREVDDFAARVATSLAGRWQPATFADAPDADAPAERDRLLRPLGSLPVHVEPAGRVVDGDAGSLQLRWTWDPGHGRPPWAYTTSVRMQRTPDGWRAVWAPDAVHRSLSAGDRLTVSRLPAGRGEVIGADERRLVHQQAVERVGVDLGEVDRQTALSTAAAMATVLGVSPDPLLARVRTAGESAFVEVASLRTGELEQRTQLQQLRSLAGFRRVVDQRPLALTPDFARPLLGVVGEATAEVIEASGGEVAEGDLVGLSGLQRAQDVKLRGAAGLLVAVRHADGSREELYRAGPVAGTPVHVALDAQVQQRADAAVASVERASALVVVRVADGHVLAAASGPGGGGASTATRARVPFAVSAPPDDLARRLGWGIESVSVPLFLGSAVDRWVSPTGVAGAAASLEAGRAVRPVVVLDGAPAPAADGLGEADRSALRSFVDAQDRHPAWAVTTRDGMVVVAYADGVDAGEVMAAFGP